jgi:hypothetical protein
MNLSTSVALVIALSTATPTVKENPPVNIVIAVDAHSHVTHSINGKEASCADVNRLIEKWGSKAKQIDCSFHKRKVP